MGLIAVQEQVDRLPKRDRELVEQGLVSVFKLMTAGSRDHVAAVVEKLQPEADEPEESADALETRNLLRVFGDWQQVRAQSVSGEQLNNLGIRKGALERRRRRGRLLALKVPFSKGLFYPRWQFSSDGQPLQAIPELLKQAKLSRLTPTDLHFLMMREDESERSLAGRLAAGEETEVLAAIAAAGAQGG